MMTAERFKLEAAQRDLDTKRAKRKAAKDANQAAADTKAKAEIALRMDRAREAAAADPDRKRKIAEADSRDEANLRSQQVAAVSDHVGTATGRRTAELVTILQDALSTCHPADAIARTVFAGRRSAKCWAEVVRWWLTDVTETVERKAQEALSTVLGEGAKWCPWQSPEVGTADLDPSDMRAIDPIGDLLDVAAVVMFWLDLPEPRPLFPLSPLATAWKQRPDPPDKAHVRVVGYVSRLPYAASEAARRSWRPVDKVTAVYVDGEPLAARLQDARPKNARHWLYVDDPEITPEPDGNLVLPDPSFRSVYPQNAHDLPLPMVALRMLGDVDGRKSLRSDLRTVLTVVFAATRPVDWSDEDGARLLARTKEGGFRPPESSDVRRWRHAVEVGDSIRLYYRDKHGSDYVRVMVADPYGDGRRELRPPAWFRERVSNSTSVGAGMGWTLTGAAHPARQRGTTATGTSYAHVISAMEYWLSRSFKGDPGIAPMLKPAHPGSSGPWVTMRWYEALQCLAMERWDRSNPTKEHAARHRFGRLVNRLHETGYMKHGDGGIGDVVECEASGRKRGATPWLRFRATARFCEAARLAQAGQWQSTGLLDWFGVR